MPSSRRVITSYSIHYTKLYENLKAIKLHGDFAPAHNNLAIAYLEKKAYDLAVEHCDRALELGYDVAPEILKEIDAHRGK